jgi:hypothetical protein
VILLSNFYFFQIVKPNLEFAAYHILFASAVIALILMLSWNNVQS